MDIPLDFCFVTPVLIFPLINKPEPLQAGPPPPPTLLAIAYYSMPPPIESPKPSGAQCSGVSPSAEVKPDAVEPQAQWMEKMFQELRPACKAVLETFWLSDKALTFKSRLREECVENPGTSKMGFRIAIGNALRACGESDLLKEWMKIAAPHPSNRKGSECRRNHTNNWKKRFKW